MGMVKKIEDKISKDILGRLRNMEENLFGDIFKRLDALEQKLDAIIKQGEKIMADIDTVMQEADVLDADTKALIDLQTKAFADLEAAVKAGTNGPNLQPLIARLQTNHAALAQALIDAQAADATTTPPVA